ncbi:hypothetical protein LMES_0897 [Leuconostoc mesenteroides KFRI-MG]|nr:hypothetical protein LMES_0897 [Leuconostoc mesenteroides KFRI-MG]
MLWHRTQLLRIDKSVIIRFFIFHFLQNRKEYINGITIYNNYWSNILYMGVIMGKRIYQIDSIKVFAIFSVVSVHFLLNSGFYDIDIESLLASIGTVLRLIFITAVPLFIMSTGFLMGEKTLDDTYVTKLGKVLLIYIVVSLIDWIGHILILHNDFSFSDALFGLLDYSTDSYGWYVEMYIGLYLIIPLLNAAWHNSEDKRYHLYIVVTSTILFFLPSLFNIFGKILPDWWTAAYPIGYYYLGLYFKTYLEQIKTIRVKSLLFYSGTVFIFLSILTLLKNYGGIFSWTTQNDYMGYQPFIVSIIIFLLFLKLPFKDEKNGSFHFLLVKISNITLTIYLFSDLTDSIVYYYFKQFVPNIEARFVWAPVIVCISFTMALMLSFSVEIILSKTIFNRIRGEKS